LARAVKGDSPIPESSIPLLAQWRFGKIQSPLGTQALGIQQALSVVLLKHD
jgi:hypothetical protein